MSRHPFDLARWNRMSLGLGGTIWMLIALAKLLNLIKLDDLKLIILLALFVISPLAVPLVPLPKENRSLCDLANLVLFLQPFATLIGEASLLLGSGGLAAAFAVVWLLFTVLIALIGVMLLLQNSDRGIPCLSGCGVDLSPIGSTWLMLDRLSVQPLGLSQTTVLLTAVHFHLSHWQR